MLVELNKRQTLLEVYILFCNNVISLFEEVAKMLEKNAGVTAFLNTAISYIQKWFDFSEENWLFLLQSLSLTSGNISFDDMEKITKRLHLVGRLNLSMDELYEECVTANSLECLTTVSREKEKCQSSGTAERWMQVLQAADIPNIQVCIICPQHPFYCFLWKGFFPS
ncbi:hypothetical protein ILYODFUR_038582 [Ilyodon furcidens]|uniref:Uncharacterized protein n=1 Tax=Ilyodon furcidens TaxID=33524 RepID=A0ABV0V0I3_9TELE